MFSRERKTPLAEWWWTVDRQLLAALILLLAVGVALSFATSPAVAERLGNSPWHFIIRHIIFVVPTLFILVGASFLNERMARYAALFLLIGSLILLMATPFFGIEANGARRWIMIFGQSLQPSEFVKPAYAIIAAWLFAEAMQRGDVPGKTIAFIVGLMIVVPLVLQPDIGQTVLVVATFSALLFLSGLSWWLIIILAGVGAGMGVGAYMFFPHVAQRIDGFLDHDAGPSYQVEKALQSVLEGGWFGRGPGEAVAKRYLPDANSDYVFSAAAGEFGILFSLALVVLIGFIIVRSLNSARRQTGLFARLCVSTIAIQFGLQSAINLAVNVKLVPSKGMTLPFVSYGGSSMLSVAFGMGILLALTRKKPHEILPTGLPAYREAAMKEAS